MITIDTKAEKTIITCNVCRKATIKLDGTRSKRAGYTKAIELGWRWKEKDVQICASCRKEAAKTNGSVKASAPKSTPKKAKDGKKLMTSVAKKVRKEISSTPFASGQSIGKVARSAKVSAAPAAE